MSRRVVLDFVGLNSLVTSSLDLTTNVISSGHSGRPAPFFFLSDHRGVAGDSLQLLSVNIHRNGPYGFAPWTQIRSSNNPLTRHHRKNSDLTFVSHPGDLVTIGPTGNRQRHRERRSDLKFFKDPHAVEKSFPLVWNVGRHYMMGDSKFLETFSILSSYGNNLLATATDEVNKHLKIFMTDDDLEYEQIKELYLEGALNEADSPITYWEFLRYKETIYPLAENMFRQEIRGRNHFESFYHHDRLQRTRLYDGTAPTPVGPTVAALSDSPFRWPSRNSALFNISQSIWPMDGRIGWGNSTVDVVDDTVTNTGQLLVSPSNISASFRQSTQRAPGILMNRHTQYNKGVKELTTTSHPFDNLIDASGITSDVTTAIAVFDNHMTAGPLYMRRSNLDVTSSCGHPSGVPIVETGSNTGGTVTQYEGGAEWTAGIMLGEPPFYNTYEDYNHEIRVKYKNYTIVPEFRMSEHVENIFKTGSLYFDDHLFEITGAIAYDTDPDADGIASEDTLGILRNDNAIARRNSKVKHGSTSAVKHFYKTYSTSDFFKHFEVLKEDHENFANSRVLRLKCKAVKKLLPYEGFYPCQRTVDLAQRFLFSYGDNINVTLTSSATTAGATPGRTTIPGNIATNNFGIGRQPIFEPLFAPGILFNTIKSGVACDYPSPQLGAPDIESLTLKTGTNRMLSGDKIFVGENRVPFEALVEPEKHMANRDFYNFEPSQYGSFPIAAAWDGTGDPFYRLMAHNFLAETIEFFLPDSNLTSIVSKKQGDGFVVEAGKSYAMRIRMKRSMNGVRNSAVELPLADGKFYYPPQDIIDNGIHESFTMYSRPLGFGPPSQGQTTFDETGGSVFRLDQQGKSLVAEEGASAGGSSRHIIKDSRHGYNFPFTPPYYHGEAWLDLEYNPSSGGKKSLTEILSQLTQSQTRFDTTFYTSNGAVITANTGPQSFGNLNANALQMTSSVNAFGIGAIQSTDITSDDTNQEVNVVVNTDTDEEKRWVIQCKFETPMLNFNHITSSDDGTSGYRYFGTEDSAGNKEEETISTIPRGMWHQLGKIPEENEGVYLEVGPIDAPWQRHVLNKTGVLFEDLSEVCGFSNVPVKLGRIAGSKEIKEAVVAVPFIEEKGRKKYFLLEEDDVRRHIDTPTATEPKDDIGLSIRSQIKKMRDYIFPPSFDFINNRNIDPIAMYIFEFKHVLDQDDLSRIWQNLPPKIARTHDEAIASITHPLLEKELLGSGVAGNNNTIEYP